MVIQINGQPATVDRTALSVSELLLERNVPDPEMVSVQINGDILERDEFGTRLVAEGDELEFLYFMGGGGHS